MANSGTVTAGSAALASQYNNLRDDVLNVSTGHTHTGASENGAKVAATGVSSGTAALGAVLTADGSGAAAFLDLAAAGADVQEFTSSGSWVKPAGKSAVYVMCVGGGGGGSGGGRAGSGDLATGGNGGNGAGDVRKWIPASLLSGTVTVTIGAGGAGGTARTTNGVPASGADGGVTSFGTYVKAVGGFSGGSNASMGAQYEALSPQQGRTTLEVGDVASAAPRTVAAASTAAKYSFYSTGTMDRNFYIGGMGNYAQTNIGRPSSDTRYGAAGGGAGGEKVSSGAANDGGAGGRGFGFTFDTAAAGGTANGGAASAAGTVGYGNGGAGGGAGSASTNGGAGSNGWLGGGGGGGGGAETGNSGAGGAGGGGWMLVISV